MINVLFCEDKGKVEKYVLLPKEYILCHYETVHQEILKSLNHVCSGSRMYFLWLIEQVKQGFVQVLLYHILLQND